MSTMRTRKKVFICNILIILLSLASIFSYFILPFWKIDLSYTLTAETIEKVLSSIGEESEDSESDSEISIEDIYKKIDFNELVGEEGITLKLTIALESKDILKSLNSDPTPLVESILKKNVETLVSQADGLIDDVVHKLLKTVVKVTVKETITQQIKNQIGEDADDAQVQEELDKLGLDEVYIDEKMDTLIEALYEENATPESAADTAITIVEEVVDKMKDSDIEEYKDIDLSEDDKEELRNTLIENLDQFTDENGNLNIGNFTTDFLVGLLTGNTESTPESTPESPDPDAGDSSVVSKNSSNIVLLSDSQSSEQTEEEAAQDLHELLTEKLMAELSEYTETIATVLKYISYVILFTFFTWAYLILKILVKMNMKNNAIKLKLPIWLGSLPFVILCLLPTVLFSTLTDPSAAFTEMIPDISEISTFTDGFRISFFSCSIVSFIIGIFFIFFSLFYYGRLRRKLKRMKKSLIVEPDYNLNDNDVEIEPQKTEIKTTQVTNPIKTAKTTETSDPTDNNK